MIVEGSVMSDAAQMDRIGTWPGFTQEHQHPGETFVQFMERERERLRDERNSVFERQGELQLKLDEINREFAAIEAYEAAKTGKAARSAQAPQQTRTRKGSRREELLTLIGQNNGLSRGDILERMGLKGDKSGEMSVSNALTALTKRNEVRREGGKYFANNTMAQAAE
jgi:hypothetical protein